MLVVFFCGSVIWDITWRRLTLHQIEMAGVAHLYERDRVVTGCPPPAWANLTLEKVYSEGERPNVKVIFEHLKQVGLLNDDLVERLLDDSLALMKQERNCINVQAPAIVVGNYFILFFCQAMTENWTRKILTSLLSQSFGDHTTQATSTVSSMIFWPSSTALASPQTTNTSFLVIM